MSMVAPPKLKVEGLGWEIPSGGYDFEEAKYLPFGHNVLIVMEGQVIRSYEDLVHLAAQPEYKNREFLEIKILEIVAGG